MTMLDLLKLLRKRLLLAIALPLAFAVATAGFSWATFQDQYAAATSVYVLSAESDSEMATRSDDLSASQLIANDIAAIVDSPTVRGATASELGVGSISGYAIEVESSSTSRIIDITVTGGSEETAEAIANMLPVVLNTVAQDVMGDVTVSAVGDAEVTVISSDPRALKYTLVAFAAGLALAVAIVVIENLVRGRSDDAGDQKASSIDSAV